MISYQTLNRIITAVGFALAIGMLLVFSFVHVQAADLGGTCCADLEDRIAELEATAATKGNRKVSLEVSGTINAELLSVDGVLGNNDKSIVQNGSEPSAIDFTGKAVIGKDLSAGFVLEIAALQKGIPGNAGNSTDLIAQQSYLFLKSATLGKLSIGKLGTATRDLNKISTENTAIVAEPLSVQPIGDAYLFGNDLPYVTPYRDAVRYDTPTWAGFTASAAWSPEASHDKMWDIALRYFGEAGQFKLAGGLGYKEDDQYALYLPGNTITAVVNNKIRDAQVKFATGAVRLSLEFQANSLN